MYLIGVSVRIKILNDIWDCVNCRLERWLFVVKKRELSLRVYEKEALKMFKIVIHEIRRLKKNSYLGDPQISLFTKYY
jgi:hypothetical protein